MKAPIPHNEAERLAALGGLDILDTEPEEVFDRIIRLVALIVNVPIVLVSLIDRDRQWFKAKIGLEASETHRDFAFCSHALLEDEILLVPNALLDPRFADNPLVTGPPDIRFYAGAPLILRDGVRLGTLCAIDREPRNLTDQQAEALRDLAAVVVDQLTLRQSIKELAKSSTLRKKSMLELQQANQALQQFAYMASHDLRAPLKKLVNLADLAILDTDGELSELIQPIRDSATQLEDLVRGFGRLVGLARGDTEERSVSVLLEGAWDAASTEMEIDLREDANLTCDPVLFTQVLVNLLDNVQKYGAGDEVVIDARTDDDGGVMITVSNSVEETFHVDHTVFAPFRRLVTGGGGKGLGLAIVERIVRLHGGSVSASCRDKTFTVELLLVNQADQ